MGNSAATNQTAGHMQTADKHLACGLTQPEILQKGIK